MAKTKEDEALSDLRKAMDIKLKTEIDDEQIEQIRKAAVRLGKILDRHSSLGEDDVPLLKGDRGELVQLGITVRQLKALHEDLIIERNLAKYEIYCEANLKPAIERGRLGGG